MTKAPFFPSSVSAQGVATPIPWLGPFLVVLLAVKIALLLVYGPAIFPDTSLYLQLGQDILDKPDWWRDGGWGTGFAPPQLLRPYGYPLLVAAAKLAAGERFGFVLGLAQSVLSVAILGLFIRISRRLIDDQRLLAAVALLSALSGFALFDTALLTDSLYCTLFLGVLSVVVAQMLGLSRAGLGISLGLGVAWAVSLSLRDVGLYHTFMPAAGLAVAARRQDAGAGRTAAVTAAFVVPVVAYVAAIFAWNDVRTGHAFFSITGAVNWLWPSFNIADRGLADPFSCADLVCQAAKAHGIGKGMDGLLILAETLWRDFHLDPLQLGHATFHHFLGVVAAHPLAFVASVLGNVQFGHLADLAFNPLANLNEFTRLHSALGSRLVPALRELFQALRHGQLGVLPWLAVSLALSGASLVGLVIFLVGTPLAARAGRQDCPGHRGAVLFLWAVTVVFVGSYSIIHMEMRHAMPVVPFILLATAWVWQWRRARSAESAVVAGQ